MNKIPAIIIVSIILLILPFSNLFAGSKSDIGVIEISEIQYRDNLIRLAQADTSIPDSDLEDDLTDDDIFDDEFMDELEELDAPHQSIADPLEPINRAFFHFNDKLYFWVLRPVAKGYGTVVPEPARRGIKNFFKNLTFPIRFVSCLFQGKFEGAGIEVDRFLINTTIGIAGFMDPAANKFDLQEHDEDIGQTLGSYGIGHGFYINWPILGPSSLTDTIGSVGDAFLDPLNYTDMKTKYDLALKGFETVNSTSLRLGDYEDLKKAAIDPYVALRDFYFQSRQNEIKK